MPISSQTYYRLNARRDALAVHFDLGLRAYDAGESGIVRRHLAAVGMLPEGGHVCSEFMALHWRVLWLEGDQEGALAVARDAMRRNPEDADACIEVADILVEHGSLVPAVDLLLEAAQRHQQDPELWYEAGIILERLERWDMRLQCFERVWQLEHAGPPSFPLWVSEVRFAEVAQEAIDCLPEHVQNALGNVVIFIEDYPEAWIFETEIADPRLLGLFDGPGRAVEMGPDVAGGPSRIYLYRWNIERGCADAADVEQQIAITVQHEIGHYLGLDEDELHARGLG